MSRSHLMPNLWYRHRGFAMVALGLLFIHIFGVLDAFLPQSSTAHAAAVWAPQFALAPLWAWGIAHAVVALMFIVGAYEDRDDLRLLRWGCIISMSLFGVKLGCYIWSVVHGSSIYSIGSGILPLLCAWAAVLEPGRQVMRRTSVDGVA